MKIKIYKIEPPNESWYWIRIITDQGYEGWGEFFGGINANAAAQIIQDLSATIVHKDPRNILDCMDSFNSWQLINMKTNHLIATAWSAINQALWDITAQMYKLPLYQLLGAYGNNEIPLYANLNKGLRNDRATKLLQERAVSALHDGFQMIKCTPFDEVMPNSIFPDVRAGLERLEAVFSNVPVSKVAIDCHQRFHRTTLTQLLEYFSTKEESPFWIEDIIALDKIDEFVEIRSRFSKFRWAGGESYCSINDFNRLINKHIFDTIMPDIRYCGGISAAKMIIPLAEENGVWVSLHNPSSPIATAFSAHATALSRYKMPLEYPYRTVESRQEATIPAEPVKNGKYILSHRSGIGLRPNERYIKKYGFEWGEGKWTKML